MALLAAQPMAQPAPLEGWPDRHEVVALGKESPGQSSLLPRETVVLVLERVLPAIRELAGRSSGGISASVPISRVCATRVTLPVMGSRLIAASTAWSYPGMEISSEGEGGVPNQVRASLCVRIGAESCRRTRNLSRNGGDAAGAGNWHDRVRFYPFHGVVCN